MNADKLIAQIEHHISINGGNRHRYPITIGQAQGKWSVTLEIDSSKRTFDIETEHPTLLGALTSAFTALKRAYAKPGTFTR